MDPTTPAPNTSTAESDLQVGERLKVARDRRGFTQGAVSARTKMVDQEQKGISRTAIIGYEQGSSKPGLREIRLLCEVLHITPNWLIFGTDSAAKAALPSMELLATSPFGELDSVLRASMALLALKDHERDSLHSLILSLAGRQLGDARLSALVSGSWMFRNAFLAALKEFDPSIEESTSLSEVADRLSRGYLTNHGNNFRLNEDGDIVNPEEEVYSDPEKKS